MFHKMYLTVSDFSRRHRCPHNNGNLLSQGEGPCQLTEYNERFVPRDMEMVQSFKPGQTVLQSTDPLSKDTTHTSRDTLLNVYSGSKFMSSIVQGVKMPSVHCSYPFFIPMSVCPYLCL